MNQRNPKSRILLKVKLQRRRYSDQKLEVNYKRSYSCFILIKGAFAAQLKAEKIARQGGRYLEPDETFGNEANLEDYVEKKEEDSDKEKKEEEPKKPMVKIMRRTDKKPGEENKDGEDRPGEGEQKKEAE